MTTLYDTATVHATSIPYTGRSHFEGQNLMESGGHTPYAHASDWLGRGMEAAELAGLAISLPMPLLLQEECRRTTTFQVPTIHLVHD